MYPFGNGAVTVLGFFVCFLKIAVYCSGVIVGLPPAGGRSKSNVVISCSRTCGFSARSISTRRCQSSRHSRRHEPTASYYNPTPFSIASLRWPSKVNNMIRLRYAKETLDNLALANFKKMACCFSATMTLVALPRMALFGRKWARRTASVQYALQARSTRSRRTRSTARLWLNYFLS